MGHIEKLEYVVTEDTNWAQCYIDTSVDEYILYMETILNVSHSISDLGLLWDMSGNESIRDERSSLTSACF